MESRLTERQIIEIFHILFLNHLGSKVSKELYTLKGGCNLRFYFKSIRYSEDIDLDIKIIAKETLKRQVSKILESLSLQQTLQTRGIRIVNFSTPKQTETVQRWKVSLSTQESEIHLPTKIEFSRRISNDLSDSLIKIEPIDSEITTHYHLYSVLCQHYPRETALIQKIQALIHRTETQARDIFDIDLLLGPHQRLQLSTPFHLDELLSAQKNALSIQFEDFKSQVITFLPPEFQSYYSNVKVWDELVLRVLSFLENLEKQDYEPIRS